MAIDWKKLLTPEQRLLVRCRNAEIARIYVLPDPFLAAELMHLARECRRLYPEHLCVPGADRGGSYDNNLVWNLVPEVAYRLGFRDLQPNERQEPRYALADLPTLRKIAGSYIANASRTCRPRDAHPQAPAIDPWDLLIREVCNGNPIAFAMDRLCPPTPEMDDGIVRSMREISGNRGVPADAWSVEWDAAWRAHRGRVRQPDPEVDALEERLLAAVPGAAEAATSIVGFAERLAARQQAAVELDQPRTP